VGFVGISGLRRERKQEKNTGEQTSSSPTSARPKEEKATRSRSKQHYVVFFFLG